MNLDHAILHVPTGGIDATRKGRQGLIGHRIEQIMRRGLCQLRRGQGFELLRILAHIG